MGDKEKSLAQPGLLSKAPSITEDLHLKNVPALNSETPNKDSRSPQLEDIKEHDESAVSITPGIKPQVVKYGNSSSTVPASSPSSSTLNTPTSASGSISTSTTTSTKKPRQTLAEVTHDLKQQLVGVAEEIEKSDAEFNRLLGNLEKKLSTMRVKLTASDSDK